MTPLQRELLRVAPHRDLRLSLSVARRYLARQPIIQPRRRIVVPRSDPRRTRRFRPISEDTVAAHLRLTNGHLTRHNHLVVGCPGDAVWYQVRECCTNVAVRLAVQSSEAWSGAVMIDDWCYYVDAGTAFANLPAAYADAAPLVESSYDNCAACNAAYPCSDAPVCGDCCINPGAVLLLQYNVSGTYHPETEPSGCVLQHFAGYVFPLVKTSVILPAPHVFQGSDPDPWDGGASTPSWIAEATLFCTDPDVWSGGLGVQMFAPVNHCGYAFSPDRAGATIADGFAPCVASRCGMCSWDQDVSGQFGNTDPIGSGGLIIHYGMVVASGIIPCPP